MTKSDTVSHIFQVQLRDTNLSDRQSKAVAEAIRQTTVKELLKLDFRIENLKPLFGPRLDAAGCSGCGGGCHAVEGAADAMRRK
jgi:hypothetical protein